MLRYVYVVVFHFTRLYYATLTYIGNLRYCENSNGRIPREPSFGRTNNVTVFIPVFKLIVDKNEKGPI